MSFDEWSKLLTNLISLIQVISWPLIVLFLLIYLRIPIKKFIEDIHEFTIKAGQSEITAKKQLTIEVAASIGAAAAIAKQNGDQNNEQVYGEHGFQEVEKLVNQLLTPQVSKRLTGSSILWVDDLPSNNTYQRNALEALGVRFTIAISTEDALKELRSRKFNVIISDMGRPSDPHAGYTLLEKVKSTGSTIPFIIYARGGNKPENKAEARRKGAFASVSGPTALFEAVIQAIGSSQ